MSVLLAAVALTTSLSGCSDTQPSTEVSPATTTSASPTPTPATVAQYASIVAGQAADVRKSAATIDACNPFAPDLACNLAALGAGISGDTIRLTLEGAYTPTSHVYIGPPPPEIATLVKETHDAAQKLSKVGHAYKPGDPYLPVQSAVDGLTRLIDAWSPYGVS